MSKLVEEMKLMNKVESHLVKNEAKLQRFYEIKNNFISKNFDEIVERKLIIEYHSDDQNGDTRYWDKIYVYFNRSNRNLSPSYLDSLIERDSKEIDTYYEVVGNHFTILPPQLKVWQLEALLDRVDIYSETYSAMNYDEYTGYTDEVCMFIKPLEVLEEHSQGEEILDSEGYTVDLDSLKNKMFV